MAEKAVFRGVEYNVGVERSAISLCLAALQVRKKPECVQHPFLDDAQVIKKALLGQGESVPNGFTVFWVAKQKGRLFGVEKEGIAQHAFVGPKDEQVIALVDILDDLYKG